MEQAKLLKQMVSFYKTTFENTFSGMVMLQDQTEKMVNMFLEQNPWIPTEGKKALNDWATAFKKGREDYKKAVDESFKKVEDFFSTPEKV